MRIQLVGPSGRPLQGPRETLAWRERNENGAKLAAAARRTRGHAAGRRQGLGHQLSDGAKGNVFHASKTLGVRIMFVLSYSLA